MKKFLLKFFLTLFAVCLSIMFGRILTESWYNTSLWLTLFSIIYLILGRYIKHVKIKQLRIEQNNKFDKVTIYNKKEFFHSIWSFYLAAFFIFMIYLILFYVARIGASI